MWSQVAGIQRLKARSKLINSLFGWRGMWLEGSSRNVPPGKVIQPPGISPWFTESITGMRHESPTSEAAGESVGEGPVGVVATTLGDAVERTAVGWGL